MSPAARPLNRAGLRRAARRLADADADLARVVARLGPPPLWDREPGFATLVRIVLEQQVSLSSARSAFGKLTAALPSLEPSAFLALDDDDLRAMGFSGQKGRYCRALAEALLDGSLDLELLPDLPDDAVRAELCRITGLGPWSADIYLLMALRRPDVWPHGDLALRAAVADLKQLPAPPTAAELEGLAEHWRPWRSVAARILWSHYLEPEPRPPRGRRRRP